MESTIDINLGGYAFRLSDAAYNALREYLQRVKIALRNHPDRKEILDSLDERLAELLGQRQREGEAIPLEDVEWAIGLVGEAQTFSPDPDQELEDPLPSITPRYRRLYRDPDDRVFGGVCGGLAHRMGIPSWVLRILFLGITLYYGLGLLVYLILYFSMPRALTPAEKLEMRGVAVTFANLQRQVERDYERSREYVRQGSRRTGQGSGGEDQRQLPSFISLLANIGLAILRVVVVLIGIGLVIVSILGLIALVAGVVPVIWMEGTEFSSEFLPWYAMHLIDLLLSSWIWPTIAFIIIAIPLCFLFLLSLQLIAQYRLRKQLSITLLCIWGLAVITLSVGYAVKWNHNAHRSPITSSETMSCLQNDTVHIVPSELMLPVDEQWDESEEWSDQIDPLNIWVNSKICYARLKIEIGPSSTQEWGLETTVLARAKNAEQGREAVERLNYHTELVGQTLYLPALSNLPDFEPEHIQMVTIQIHVPEGGSFVVDPNFLNRVWILRDGQKETFPQNGYSKVYRREGDEFIMTSYEAPPAYRSAHGARIPADSCRPIRADDFQEGDENTKVVVIE